MEKENSYSVKMRKKTDEELKDIVSDHSKYQEDFVKAAIWEREGRKLDGVEDKGLIERFEAKERSHYETDSADPNITTNLQAPLLYRRKYVLIYGFIFSVFAGSILHSSNFSELGQKKLSGQILLIGLGFSLGIALLTVLISSLDYSAPTSIIVLTLNLLGMFLLEKKSG